MPATPREQWQLEVAVHTAYDLARHISTLADAFADELDDTGLMQTADLLLGAKALADIVLEHHQVLVSTLRDAGILPMKPEVAS